MRKVTTVIVALMICGVVFTGLGVAGDCNVLPGFETSNNGQCNTNSVNDTSVDSTPTTSSTSLPGANNPVFHNGSLYYKAGTLEKWNVSSETQDWSVNLPSYSYGQMLVTDSGVYVSSGSKLYKYDHNGTLINSVNQSASGGLTIVGDDHVLYWKGSELRTIDDTTGEVNTVMSLSGEPNSIIAVNTTTYVSGNSKIIAIDTTTKQKMWEVTTQADTKLMSNGDIVLGHSETEVIALNSTSGATLWNETGENIKDTAIYQDYLIEGDYIDDQYQVTNLTTGNQIASQTGGQYGGFVTIVNGEVYGVDDNGGTIRKMTLPDLNQQWSVSSDNNPTGSLTVYRGLYLGNQKFGSYDSTADSDSYDTGGKLQYNTPEPTATPSPTPSPTPTPDDNTTPTDTSTPVPGGSDSGGLPLGSTFGIPNLVLGGVTVSGIVGSLLFLREQDVLWI